MGGIFFSSLLCVVTCSLHKDSWHLSIMDTRADTSVQSLAIANQPVQQSISDQRNELVSSLTTHLNVSVLQVMKAQASMTNFPGAVKHPAPATTVAASTGPATTVADDLAAGASPTTVGAPLGSVASGTMTDAEKDARMATGLLVIQSLNNTQAISVVEALGLTSTFIDHGRSFFPNSSSQTVLPDQLPAQYQDDDGALAGFVSRIGDDWCTLKAMSVGIWGSEAYVGALFHFMVATMCDANSTCVTPGGGSLCNVIEALREEMSIHGLQDDLLQDAEKCVTAYLLEYPIHGALEIAILSQALACTSVILNAQNVDGNYIQVNMGGSLGVNPESGDSKFSIWLCHWYYGDDDPGHFDVFTVSGMFPRRSIRSAFVVPNPHVTVRPRPTTTSDAGSPPLQPSPVSLSTHGSWDLVVSPSASGSGQSQVPALVSPIAPPTSSAVVGRSGSGRPVSPHPNPYVAQATTVPPQYLPLSATPHVNSRDGSPVLQGRLCKPGFHPPQVPSTSVERSPDDDLEDGMRTPFSTFGSAQRALPRLGGPLPTWHPLDAGDQRREFPPPGLEQREANQLDQNFARAVQVALNQLNGQGSQAQLPAASALAVPSTSFGGPRPGTTVPSATDFWGSIDRNLTAARSEQSTLSPYSHLDGVTGVELTHQQLQQVKGLGELRDSPRLALTEKFNPENFKLVYAWIETLVKKITSAHPSKGPLFLSLVSHAIEVHNAMLTIPVTERDKLLQGFRSQVGGYDPLNQTVSRRWTAFIIEGLPPHVSNKLQLQKTSWSSRLLGDGLNSTSKPTISTTNLNLHNLVSPLCTPDGCITVVLLSMFSDHGDQRLLLQKYITGLPPCPDALSFTSKFDQWVNMLTSVRGVGVALPDASLLWGTFVKFVSKIRQEQPTIEHYFQDLILTELTDPILASDELRVMRLIDQASGRIVTLLDSGSLAAKSVAPKATPKAASSGAPALLQVTPKGGGKGYTPKTTPKGGGKGQKGKGSGAPKATGPAPPTLRNDQAQPPQFPPVCVKWVEGNGVCIKGTECSHVAAHTWPITQAMRESVQRIIAARARNIAKGKGKGNSFRSNGPKPPGHHSPPLPAPIRENPNPDPADDWGVPYEIQRLGARVDHLQNAAERLRDAPPLYHSDVHDAYLQTEFAPAPQTSWEQEFQTLVDRGVLTVHRVDSTGSNPADLAAHPVPLPNLDPLGLLEDRGAEPVLAGFDLPPPALGPRFPPLGLAAPSPTWTSARTRSIAIESGPSNLGEVEHSRVHSTRLTEILAEILNEDDDPVWTCEDRIRTCGLHASRDPVFTEDFLCMSLVDRVQRLAGDLVPLDVIAEALFSAPMLGKHRCGQLCFGRLLQAFGGPTGAFIASYSQRDYHRFRNHHQGYPRSFDLWVEEEWITTVVARHLLPERVVAHLSTEVALTNAGDSLCSQFFSSSRFTPLHVPVKECSHCRRFVQAVLPSQRLVTCLQCNGLHCPVRCPGVCPSTLPPLPEPPSFFDDDGGGPPTFPGFTPGFLMGKPGSATGFRRQRNWGKTNKPDTDSL